MRVGPAFAFALVIGLAAPARAQDRPPAASDPPAAAQARDLRPPPHVPFDFRAYLHFDEVWMSASQSFDAVVGTSSLTAGGVGVDIINLWRGVFARAGIARMGGHGSRVFISGDDIVPLNVPIAIGVRTLELGAGWRYTHSRYPTSVVYGGADLLHITYHEKSKLADGDADVTTDGFWGSTLFGGVEIKIWKRIVAGAEVQFRSVPNALGEGGVSALYNETNLGGFAIRGLIGIRK
jgi:hypothetical protein